MFYRDKKQQTLSKGVFIVIDGTDGSGKKTQLDLLVNKLKANGFAVETADFPQYGKKSAGLVEEYLNGKFGTADEVGPYRASIFYAIDRYDASFQIKRWLDEGKIVVSNRYVTANMGHQGGKIQNALERKSYFDWLYNLEYKIFNIPKPDLNIILHVDAAVAQALVDQKGARDYISSGAKRDIHEADINHLRNAETVYLEIARTFPDFKLIECTRGNQIIPKENISDMVWQETARLIEPLLLQPVYEERQVAPPDFYKLHLEQAPIQKMPDILKIERLTHTAKLPTRAHTNDAGLDLYADDYYSLMPGERATIKTGLKMALPRGSVGLIWDKSGIAKAGIHTIAGVVDADYRGEWLITIINLSNDIYNIAPGQKVAQMLIQKIETPVILEGKITDNTSRGESSFGSSGLY